jgi:hypothetical protein
MQMILSAIGLHGFGCIDGQGKAFIAEDLTYIYRPKKWRPGLISFLNCKNVTFRDITLRDSAWWTVHLIGCQDVLIHGIRIDNDLKMPTVTGLTRTTAGMFVSVIAIYAVLTIALYLKTPHHTSTLALAKTSP